MAEIAPVSFANLLAWLNLGTAIVMMMRMIEITISSSMREKPRRAALVLLRSDMLVPLTLLLYDAATPPGVEKPREWGGPPLSSTKFGVRVFSSPSFLRIARSSNLQRPSLPFPHLRTALPSEPGPVKAERSDRREQVSRRVAWTGGSEGAPLVMREWQAAQRRCTLSSRRSRLLSLLPVRRVRLLPFALSSPCSSCACWSSRLLPGA